jgi:photosystem II stability/assembly factor-like uncharacterized protein
MTTVECRMNACRFVVPFLILVSAMSGCARAGPTSAPPTITPAPIIPTAVAGPSPTPALITPTAATSAVTTPPPTPAAPAPLESGSLPAILADVDLGVHFEQPLQHALALDVDRGRLFVSAPPDRTLVISTEDWSITDTLSLGGGVAVDRSHERLFVGAPDGVSVFDLDGLRLIGTIPITADLFGSTPIPDESADKLFVVYNGVYITYPTALTVMERISGTFPISPGLTMSPYAADATLDAQNRRLYISLNNGIPGSNNGNTLIVYDLKSGAMVYRDNERSVVSLAADESSGRLFVARSRMNFSSLSMIEDGIKPTLRVNGISGSVKVDTQRKRVYLADVSTSRLLVLDATTGALIADVPLPRICTLAAFDADNDRLYLLSPDGHLLVMRGHGAAATAPTAIEPTGVVTGSVAWIAPSPDFVRDPPAGVLFAAWTEEGTISGRPAGALAGRLFASADGGATWSRVSGGLPSDLLVNALAFSPDFVRDRVMFASLLSPSGSGGGIYISKDAGRSWRPVTQGLSDWIVSEIAVAPGFPFNGTVFALTWQSGLFRSTDGGVTWTRTGYQASPPVGMNTRTLVISPDFVNDNTLVVSTGEGTSISRDGGENWWALVENRATSLALSPDRKFLGSFNDVGVLRSDDGGTTWQAASRGLRFDVGSRVALALSPDFSRDRTAFALVQSSERSAVYRMTDSGMTWQIEISGLAGKAQVTALAVSPDLARDGLILAGLDSGQLRVVKVSDLKWSNAPAALDKLNVEAIALSPDYANDQTVFIGGGRTGLFVSTNGGKTWQETNFPARDTGVGHLSIALSPDYANDKMVFASAGGQAFRSDDGGANWQILSSGLGSFFPTSAVAVSPRFADDHAVLIGGGFRAPRVMRSTDAGQTWSATNGLLQNNGVPVMAFAPGNGRVAYAWADQSGLYRSGDGGAMWTRVFSPTETVDISSWSIQSLGISPDFVRDRLMFAGFVGPQNFRRSADGGATWHPSDIGLTPGLLWGSALAVWPDASMRDRLIWLGSDKGVFRSEDGGVTWKASSAGLPQVGVLALALSPNFSDDHTILAGLVDRGLYISTDGGANWKPPK